MPGPTCQRLPEVYSVLPGAMWSGVRERWGRMFRYDDVAARSGRGRGGQVGRVAADRHPEPPGMDVGRAEADGTRRWRRRPTPRRLDAGRRAGANFPTRRLTTASCRAVTPPSSPRSAHYDTYHHGLEHAAQSANLDAPFLRRFCVIGRPEQCADRLGQLIKTGLSHLTVVSGSRDLDPAVGGARTTSSPRRCFPRYGRVNGPIAHRDGVQLLPYAWLRVNESDNRAQCSSGAPLSPGGDGIPNAATWLITGASSEVRYAAADVRPRRPAGPG